MNLPNYQQFMEPCLKVLSGGGLISKPDLVGKVSDLVGLSEEQRQVMLDSGKSTIARSRISWALAYMKQAGVVDNPRRGFYTITERGQGLLDAPERPISTKMLDRFEEFRDFRQRSGTRSTSDSTTSEEGESDLSPDEQLTVASKAIRADVQSQLLDQLRSVDAGRFEHVVIDVLRAMGYGVDSADAARVVGRAGDEGIDGVIDQDILGLDSIYVQAKRWQGPVSRPEVQAFAGALQGQNATKGVMITTSTFSQPAIEYVKAIGGTRIVLIDGVRLAGLMYDHGIGVSEATVVVTRKLDTDYFSIDD
jgi:restriction system protein